MRGRLRRRVLDHIGKFLQVAAEGRFNEAVEVVEEGTEQESFEQEPREQLALWSEDKR